MKNYRGDGWINNLDRMIGVLLILLHHIKLGIYLIQSLLLRVTNFPFFIHFSLAISGHRQAIGNGPVCCILQ